MSIMANYVRIFQLEPTDDFVGKRNRAVNTISNWLNGLSPSRLLGVSSKIANAIVMDSLSEDIAQEVEKALAAESDSFIRQGQDRQMIVCLMVAALDLIRSQTVVPKGWLPVDALAVSLWSSLSFQHPCRDELLERLRVDLMEASRERVMTLAEISRKRFAVPEISAISIPAEETSGKRLNTAFSNATKPTVDALYKNAELDREEIDFLWWVLSDRSDTLGIPLAQLENASRAIVAGIDGAKKLRQLPSDGHKHVVLRSVRDTEEMLSLSEAIAQLACYREKLSESCTFIHSPMVENSAVFPLFSSLAAGKSDIHGTDIKRTPREWGARALLEGSILQIDAGKVSL